MGGRRALGALAELVVPRLRLRLETVRSVLDVRMMENSGTVAVRFCGQSDNDGGGDQ